MKVGCCSSRCLALLLLALLEAVTLVFPQQQQRCEDLTNTCIMLTMPDIPLSVVATGMEMSRPRCSIISPMETGDMIDWYFTRTTTESATRINIDGSKYEVEGQLSQILIVNNVSLNDEGYYFCQLNRSGQLIPQKGSCLRVLAPAMFQTCSGVNVPQRGCSETEMLNATIGESVDFNIVLVHGGSRNESCNDQFIQMISLFKDGPSSRITLTDCPSSACSHNVSLMDRLKVSRTPNEFNITVTLKNLTAADSGSYSAVADIRTPSNSMRLCMYKNFTLNVLENPSTTTPTTSGDTQSSISPSGGSSLSEDVLIIIIIVIVVLVVLLMVLGVVVAGLLCWTYKNRHKEKKGEKDGEMYETIKDVKKFKREKKKKKSNGVPLTDQEDTYQRRSVVEEEKMNLPEVWNSDGHPV